MTAQREKDIETAYHYATHRGTNDHWTEHFADGAEYGRRDAAKRLREIIRISRELGYTDIRPSVLARICVELERNE